MILLSNIGLGLDYILMALAPSVSWLLVGRVISGICAASFSVPTAYIADVTPPEKRAASFGMLGAAFGLGFIVGPAFGGLLGVVDPRLPFWVAAAFSLANGAYGYFILPESLPLERRSAFHWRRANPIGALSLLSRHSSLLGIAGVILLSALAHESLPSMWVLYTDYRYHWTAGTVGITLALMGACSAVVQAGLIGVVVARLGERRALLLGLVFGATGFAIFALAPTGLLFAAGIPFIALWGFSGASCQSLMTRQVDPSEQGRLQGAIAALRGFADMIGPGLFTTSFAVCISADNDWELPAAPYFLAALILAIAIPVAWRSAPGTSDRFDFGQRRTRSQPERNRGLTESPNAQRGRGAAPYNPHRRHRAWRKPHGNCRSSTHSRRGDCQGDCRGLVFKRGHCISSFSRSAPRH